MKSAILTFAFLSLANYLVCQVTLFGYVTDDLKEPIAGAHVIAGNAVSITNSYGFYSITPGSGSIFLSCSHVGFKTGTFSLEVTSTQQFDIVLAHETLDEVIVSEEKVNLDIRKRIDIGTNNIPINRLIEVPSLTGQRDVIKGLTILPGIHSATEASAGLFIRGGTPDQNLLLIDNVPVHNPYHLFGLFSVFNSDAVKNVEVYKGKIPAKYGDRLSSVISVKIKEGNLRKWKSKYNMGLISSSIVADGPIKKDTTGLLVAGRISYLSLLTLPLRLLTATGVNIDSYADYTLYDINAKLHHVINNRKKIFINFYAGNDRHVGLSQIKRTITSTDKTAIGYNWGNATLSIRKTNQLGSRTFVEDQLLFTRYSTNLFGRQKEIENTNKSEYVQKRFSVLSEATYSKQVSHWTPNNHWITAGLSLSYRRAVPIRTTFRSTFDDIETPKPVRKIENGYLGSVFLEDNWKLSETWILDFGIRSQIYFPGKKVYHSLEPRVNIGKALSDNLSWNVAYTRTSQSIHGLSGVYEALPIHGWVNASVRTPIQLADQISSGLKYQTNNTEITLDGYYRTFKNQIDFQDGRSLLSGYNTNFEELVERGGDGYAYGAEFLLNKSAGRLKYMLSYTLSWNWRQFASISQGEKYFHRSDQRHNLSLFSSYKLNPNLDFSMFFQFNSGARQSLPTQIFEAPDPFYDIFYSPLRNNFVGPSYHRLDLSLSYKWVGKKKKKRKKSLTLNLTNAYFRKNVSYYELEEDYIYDDNFNFLRTEYVLKEIAILPIVPSFTYTVDLGRK